MHIRPSGEESLKHLTGGLGVVVVVVHGPKVVVERLDFGSRQLELIDQNAGVILSGKCGPNIHLWIHKTNVFQQHDGVGNLFGPIAPTGLYHAAGKPMQGNVENMTSLSCKPSGEPAELIVVLDEQDAVTGLRQHVGSGQAA